MPNAATTIENWLLPLLIHSDPAKAMRRLLSEYAIAFVESDHARAAELATAIREAIARHDSQPLH